jgi:hypothetical protein
MIHIQYDPDFEFLSLVFSKISDMKYQTVLQDRAVVARCSFQSATIPLCG